MSMYIPLGKIPTSPEEREALLAGKAAEADSLSELGLTMLQRDMVELLKSRKGYLEGEIETNKRFHVETADTAFDVSADIAIKIDNRVCLIIKCALNSIESWERHSTAFCRVAEAGYQIPLAVVTDGENARVLDILDGGPVREGLDCLPSAEDARRMMRAFVPTAFPEDRKEREKRILYAFDAIRCSSTICDDK